MALSKFRKTIDDAEPHFIAYLHLHHLGGQTGPYTLGILQLELHLSTAAFDQVKDQHRGQPLELFIGGVLAHVEDL